jgi:hypothetical protein
MRKEMLALLGFLRKQIGLRTDSASATGSLHARVADISAKNIIAGGSAIKSIQRGTIAITGSNATATISPVNTSKSMVSFLGFTTSINDDTIPPNRIFPLVNLSDSTTVYAARSSTYTNTTITVSYEIIEFY